MNYFLGLLLGYAFACIVAANPFKFEALTDDIYKGSFFRVSGFLTVVTIIILVLCGSTIISDLKMKQQKIDELMFPATNLEKFTARFLGSTLFLVVLTVAAFFVADALQMLINMIIHKGTFASLAVTTKQLLIETHHFYDTDGEDNALNRVLFFFFTTNAAYILGGMLFRKAAWLKTSLALIVIGIATTSLFIGYGYMIYRYTDYVVYIPEWVKNNPWILWGWGIIQVFICYYLAYRIYCKLQAVNTRWLNI
ncbi:hypothetical protein [Prevotella disiens]|nr:hypothetical protein [Prevotella disiens]